MEQKKMKIEYRKQIDSETAPWQPLTNVDELLWNGVYALRVTADDGSHNLPFRLADDDTVTIVVKDHAHDGMLENARTVVQTVTRADRATGNVFVYTRTRYNAGGTHSWSYWTLAGEGSTAVEIPTASTTSLGAVIVGNGLAVDADGKLSLAAASVGKEQLTADLGTQIDSMAEKLRFAGSLTVNDGTLLHIGALVENSTPYSGTNFSAYTDMLLSNGEQLVVNEGYLISAYKVFEGEQEIAFIGNQNLTHFSLDGEHLNYQLEFKKSNTGAFAVSELPMVIKNFQRNPIVWSANSNTDNYIAPGTYNIHGDRTNLSDGLPIYNTGSFSARLTVLASNNCVTQVLTLLNVGGGDSNVYTRTRQGGNWGAWSKLQQNVEVGAIGLGQERTFDHLIDNGMYSGYNLYQTGTDEYAAPIVAYETFVLVVINAYLTGGSISQLKYSLLQNGKTTVATREKTGESWSEWRDLDAVTTSRIQDGAVEAHKLSADVREKVEKIPSLEKTLEKEKTALVNGDTVVGLAREVYSRQGKTDTATFLKRTTAGGTSISDGVATLKQIGGNIVNNKIIDKPFASGAMNYVSGAVTNVICPGGVGSLSFTGYLTANNYEIPSHIYYVSAFVKAQGTGILNFSYTNSSGLGESAFTIEIPLNAKWEYVSCRYKSAPSSSAYYRACSFGCPNADSDITAQIYSVLYVDLTEMYGAGNEPDKATCDRLFGTMDALPQGLTIAKPAEFKSIGYNQWNPANLFTGKTVADNAIVDGENSIAFFECLPCKIGVGENNGYVIGYGEGDDWSDAGIEVYLTPIYPMTGDGLLYAHKLEKDATTGTYVPKIKGYLLVVTPVTDKLCAHFLWSGDRSKTDYEPYIESNLALPQIPEMSEWGLAAISVRGTTVQDIIDLENKRYKKSIGCFDMGSKVGGMVGNIYHISIPDAAKSIAGVVPNLLCAKYKTVLRNNMDTLGLNTISQNDNSSTITLYDSSCTTAEEYAAKLKGVMLYYELATPEEYPIVAKSAPNYIGSDYGVEVFMGSKVPLNANILFYMRSLVSETRVFIDRLMAGLGVSDATVVADRIIAAIRSHNAVEEGPATE